jgi:hypothetical protein
MSQELIDFSAQIDEQFVIDDIIEDGFLDYLLVIFK